MPRLLHAPAWPEITNGTVSPSQYWASNVTALSNTTNVTVNAQTWADDISGTQTFQAAWHDINRTQSYYQFQISAQALQSMANYTYAFDHALREVGGAVQQANEAMQRAAPQWAQPYTTGSSAMVINSITVTDLGEWASGQPAALTPEERIRRARRDAAARKRRRLATRRGAKLLLSLLTEEQQYEYARSQRITVTAADGRVFRLRKGRTVELLGADGEADAAYCIHLYGGYVDEDTLICQLVALQTDPAEFERIANVTQIRKPKIEVARVVPLRRAA